jgi:ADP-ribose pyrophosphatase YjhB (NUDIX family)
MDIEELKQRTVPRVQAIVCRGRRILMVKHQDAVEDYWCLPGGALEDGETPEDGALRELREETGVDGRIVRCVARVLNDRGGIAAYTYLVDIGDQEPAVGHDPEIEGGEPILVDVRWKALREIPERDRVFLWSDGLLAVEGFREEISNWGDDTSYPAG